MLILAIGILGAVGSTATPFRSAEVAFTDSSAHGLAIVPASCPSYPHYSGDCSILPSGCGPGTLNDQCTSTPPSGCTGSSCTGAPTTCPDGSPIPANGICTTGLIGRCVATVSCTNSTTAHYVNSSCYASDIACPTNWSCSAGACVPPPAAQFNAFTATGADGTSFAASGALSARPVLLAPGSTTRLYWNVANAQSCSITSSTGTDNWTSASSGGSGVVSSPITQQTVYTLTCNSIAGAYPPTVSGSVTINLIPTFQEI